MLRSAAVFVFAAAFVLMAAPRARACKCAEPPPAIEAASNAAAVFEGRVTEVQPVGSADFVVSLEVVRAWKGAKSLEHVQVRTRNDTAACGFPFEKDESYLVYAEAVPKERDLPALSVLHCGRTRVITEADADIAQLGMGATPVNAGPSELATKPAAPPPPKPVAEGVLGNQQNKPAAGGCASCGIVGAPHGAGGATFGWAVWVVTLVIGSRVRRGRSRSRS
jgi:hypothetical protein